MGSVFTHSTIWASTVDINSNNEMAKEGKTVEIDLESLRTLQAKVAQLSARILALEKIPVYSEHAVASSQTQQSFASNLSPNTSVKNKKSWTEAFKIKGDIRSRFENIDDENKPSDRNRHRVRARAEISARVNDRWSAGIGMASGGSDPRSTNQSLGGAGSTKDLGLDLAYISFAPTDTLTLTSGKFKNPFVRVGGYHLVWDGDYRPEGFAFKYAHKNWHANAMIHFLESDNGSGSKDAETSYGLQVVTTQQISQQFTLLAGASYYLFGIQGSRPFYNNDPAGNSVGTDGRYLHDYQQIELFAELSTSIANLPVSAFVDLVNNQDTDTQDTAWALGLKLGKSKAPHTWEIAYRYQDLEADALYGAVTDADFAAGRTDNRGHVIQAAYAPYKNTKLGLKYFITKYGNHSSSINKDYNRLQLDLALKF